MGDDDGDNRVRGSQAMDSRDGDGGEPERTPTQRHRIGLTASQVAASALAASCAAIVASYLGVAGTISGAAIGSIVATTGSAFYGHAFHTGGKKIVDRLGPNGFPISELRLKALITARAEAGRAKGPASAARTVRAGLAEFKQGFGYRKAAALAAALLVVFGAALTVGLLAGGPVRQAGAGDQLQAGAHRHPDADGHPNSRSERIRQPQRGSDGDYRPYGVGFGESVREPRRHVFGRLRDCQPAGRGPDRADVSVTRRVPVTQGSPVTQGLNSSRRVTGRKQ